jgi:conjugal transfer pilus assembly protein TraF
MRILFIFVILCLGFVNDAFAAKDFYKQSHRGWFNFEEKQQEELQEQTSGAVSYATAAEELKVFQKEFDERKAKMVLHPNIQNVRSYLTYQNKMFALADELGVAWKSALLSNPALNIAKDISHTDAAVKIRDAEEQVVQEKTILNLNKQFKLLFFYKHDCKYCHHFAEVLAAFATKYKFKVASVTMDGGQLQQFPAIQNPDLVKNLNISTTPTLMIFSEELGIIAPVSHGFISLDMLEKNMFFVAKQLREKL